VQTNCNHFIFLFHCPIFSDEWWDDGVVMCLGQGADLHMAQLMPLRLIMISLAPVNPDWFYLSGAGSPR